jgi:hypothetical protein
VGIHSFLLDVNKSRHRVGPKFRLLDGPPGCLYEPGCGQRLFLDLNLKSPFSRLIERLRLPERFV